MKSWLLLWLLSSLAMAQELVLPQGLESRRPEFIETLSKAQQRLERFCAGHDWGFLLREPIIKKVQIFDSKADYDALLRQLYPEGAQMTIPATFVAGFEKDFFFAVSPEIYAKNVAKFVEPQFYEKLITHEMAHKLHIRLVNGQEEKMGPIWFWEGFATFVASQFEAEPCTISREQVEAVMATPERGDYRLYNQTFKYFVKLVPIQELVRRAGQDGFHEWLLENV